MPEFLSICIPTYNRASILKELLTSFARQVREDKIPDGEVVFYISDNAATDATPQVVKEFENNPLKIVYSRNEKNIGISRNLNKVCAMAKGRFIWTLGDDEVISAHALANLLKALRQHDPGMLIAFDTRYAFKLPQPQVFKDYQSFARECVRLGNSHPLAEQTLLSSNIFRSDCYDGKYAEESVDTWFPHMFGIIRPLCRKHAPVVLPDFPIITTRVEERSTPSDGVWADLDACWQFYMKWLRDEMQLPELDPYGPTNVARQAMLENIKKHPIAYLRRYWRALFQPTAYKFVFSRLFRRS